MRVLYFYFSGLKTLFILCFLCVWFVWFGCLILISFRFCSLTTFPTFINHLCFRFPGVICRVQERVLLAKEGVL